MELYSAADIKLTLGGVLVRPIRVIHDADLDNDGFWKRWTSPHQSGSTVTTEMRGDLVATIGLL
jgi:hypothetical protein